MNLETLKGKATASEFALIKAVESAAKFDALKILRDAIHKVGAPSYDPSMPAQSVLNWFKAVRDVVEQDGES